MIVGEEEDATGKGRRMESDMTPVVDSGVRKFLGLIYSCNTKELFEKGFRKVRRWRWFREIVQF